MGAVFWFNYDGQNYLEATHKSSGKARLNDLHAHIRFWGEDPKSKGVYLKMSNGTNAPGDGTNEYEFNICCVEQMFE